jgi:hypothetical protein
MKSHLLVFDGESSLGVDLRGFVDNLDNGAEMHVPNGHVCFLRSGLCVSELNDKFLQFAGSNRFLITELGSNYAGRMTEAFWDFLNKEREKNLSPAA